jgi:uncharacterized protein involved in response to NO
MSSFGTTMDNAPRERRFALFDYGFRPFFLLAGLYAAALVPIWLYVYAHSATAFGSLPPMYWHAHEMLYGFVGAAIAGFLLTAVPSWTGARGFAGTPLRMLVLAWAAGRIAMATLGVTPFWIVALAELSMLALLAALLLPPLMRSQNRNMPMLAVLGILWLIDAAFLVALKNGDVLLASRAMTLAIDFVLILVTIIGGRIVPAFTANALRRRGEDPDIVIRKGIEIAAIGSMILIAAFDVFAPIGYASAILAAIAAVVHTIRLLGWRSFKARGESILWILHVGYAWLPIGLALKACYLLGGFDWASKWQHALTAGVFGTMILAVMTRASLGHTGRALVVSSVITAAYALLTLGVAVRVLSSVARPEYYVAAVCVAGAAWTLAFALFVVVYAPILIKPRADGKPG